MVIGLWFISMHQPAHPPNHPSGPTTSQHPPTLFMGPGPQRRMSTSVPGEGRCFLQGVGWGGVGWGGWGGV